METGETGVPGNLGQSVQYLVEEENNLGVGKGNVAIHLVRVTIQKRRVWTVTQMRIVQERKIIYSGFQAKVCTTFLALA